MRVPTANHNLPQSLPHHQVKFVSGIFKGFRCLIRFWEMKKEQQLSLVTLFAQRTSAPSVNVAFRRTRRMGANGANATKMVSFLRTSGRTLRMACLASEARPICNPLNYSEERMAMTKCCGTTRSRFSPWISHFWIEV